MQDRYGRTINYMRISVTEGCNLRCRYCMPEGFKVQGTDCLSAEEIVCVVRAALGAGIDRFKITGGEPLVRSDVPALIRKIKGITGVRQVTMTSNGILLSRYLQELYENGLDAVNISLDTLDRVRYRQITGYDSLDAVLKGIDDALSYGLRVKLNSVLMEGINDDEFPVLVRMAKERPLDVRFIEMMPIGQGVRFRGLNNTKLLKQLLYDYPSAIRDYTPHGNGPAVYVKIPGYAGSIGFIGAMHGNFCDHCNRLRLTANGSLKACLCYEDRIDLKEILRSTSGTEADIIERLTACIRTAVHNKPQAHSFLTPHRVSEAADMVSIGG